MAKENGRQEENNEEIKFPMSIFSEPLWGEIVL